MVGILVSFSDGLFQGAMSVFRECTLPLFFLEFLVGIERGKCLWAYELTSTKQKPLNSGLVTVDPTFPLIPTWLLSIVDGSYKTVKNLPSRFKGKGSSGNSSNIAEK